MQYHFKSIDTWLMGICQSHCAEHSWKRSKYQPGKKSIFAENPQNGTQDQDAEQEDEEVGSQVNEDEKSNLSVEGSSGKDVHCDALDQEKSNREIVAQHSAASNTNCSVVQELSSDKNAATDHQSPTATTSQYIQTSFDSLDECVSWLLSTISLDLESEFYDTSCSPSGLKLGSSQWIEAGSSNNQDKGFVDEIVENPSANQRMVEAISLSELETSCQCPQCWRIDMSCIHQGSNYASTEDDDEKCRSIEDCKEFSSSLECFDFVHCGMSSDDIPINQCPNNSSSSGRRKSRSVSPSKAARNGKGRLLQPA